MQTYCALLIGFVLATNVQAADETNEEELIVNHESSVAVTESDAAGPTEQASERATEQPSDEYAVIEDEEAFERVSGSKLVKRYRVRKYGSRSVRVVDYDADEYVDYDEDEYIDYDSPRRRTSYSTIRRSRDRHHNHALDHVAVGLAVALPFLAYQSYDRRHRGYGHRGNGHRGYGHRGYNRYARSHRWGRNHHRRGR